MGHPAQALHIAYLHAGTVSAVRYSMENKSLKPKARISRIKCQRSPLATGWGFAWKYLYTAKGEDGVLIVEHTDMLSNAESMARRAGYIPIRVWQ